MAELVLTFELFPGRTLTLALFRDVTNAKEIRASINEEPEAAFLNASLLVDPFIIHQAGHKALASQAAGSLTTKKLHTELIYNVSGTKHVAESLKRFGVTDDSTAVLAARFDCTPPELEVLTSRVKGTQVPLSDLGSLADVAQVDKLYKITAEELKNRSRTDAVIFRVGAKECS